jgi:ankyrin repeat protein
MHAASKGEAETVAALLKSGADPNYRTPNGDTPLTFANRWKQRPEIVELLVANGANRKKAREWKELVRGAQGNGNMSHNVSTAINFLLQHKGSQRDLNDFLCATASQGNTLLIEFALRQGASVNALSASGRTALIYAARFGHFDAIKLLLEKGANINHQAHAGETALFEAASQGHLLAVEYLLEKGADRNLKDQQGKTAIEAAKFMGRGRDELNYKRVVAVLFDRSSNQ